MFETFGDFGDFIEDHWIMVVAVIIGVIILIIAFYGMTKAVEYQPVNSYNMPGGVTCYTFNTSISCLQVEK